MGELRGRRIPDNTFLGNPDLQPGDYGRDLITKTRNGKEVQEWDWFVCCPNGESQFLWVNEDDQNGGRHIVTEHEDGTISVEGSIRNCPVKNNSGIAGYHGYLRRGVWTDD